MNSSTVARINAFGESHNISLRFDHYQNGRIAIRAMNHEGQFGMLTVNIPDVPIAENEFILKNYSENAGWAEECVAQFGQFENTGRFARSGFVTCPIYRIKTPPA
jgi:hypothetical protein